MKIRPVGAELFQTDRRTDMTDMTKLIIVFRGFANAPKTPFSHGSSVKKQYLELSSDGTSGEDSRAASVLHVHEHKLRAGIAVKSAPHARLKCGLSNMWNIAPSRVTMLV